MKKIQIYFTVLIASIAIIAGCVKNDDVVYTGSVAELDAATWNAASFGVTYPILPRVPAMGRATSSACPDSTLRRNSGLVRIRVNLVGPQSDKEETVGFKTFSAPITSIAFPATNAANAANGCPSAQIPSAAAGTLVVSDAVAGVDYNITSGTNKITIPAKSSFGYIDIQIINSAAMAGQSRFIGIELDESGTLKPNFNYRQLGLVIDKR